MAKYLEMEGSIQIDLEAIFKQIIRSIDEQKPKEETKDE